MSHAGHGEEAKIEFDGVSKQFPGKLAVDGIDLRIDRGMFVGLLGRNGAGKSTLLNLVTGLFPASSGTIRVAGLEVEKHLHEVKRRIGVMPEQMALLDRLSGEQYLRFAGRMHGLEDDLIKERSAELFARLELDASPGMRLLDYSYGMKKKVAFSAAVLHQPEVLFLDEPFEGIDPLTSRTLKDLLQNMQRSGVTIVLSSHVLEIVEQICSHVALLDEGRLVAFCSPRELGRERGERDDDPSLERKFVALIGGAQPGTLTWL